MGPGGVEMSGTVPGQRRTPTGPGVIMLCLGRAIDPFLDVQQNFLVARTQITLGKRNATIADIPRVRMSGCLAGPVADKLQIFILASGEQE